MENRDRDSDSKNYMDRIGRAIEQHETLTELLIAARNELPHVKANASVTRLLEALQTKVPAELWVTDPRLASMLPIVLEANSNWLSEGEDGTARSSESIRRLLSDTVGNRWRIPKEYMYPVVLLIVSFLLLMWILATIVPVYEKMFLELGLLLPWSTTALVQLGRFAQYQTIAFLLAVIALVSTIVLAVVRGSGLLHRLQVVPSIAYFMAGSRRNLSCMVRWTSTLAELLRIGTPVPNAIEIAGVASQSEYYRRQSNRWARYLLQSGTNPMEYPDAAVAFPATVVKALEGTPNVAILRRMADIYADRLRTRKGRGYGIIGPIAIVMIGLMIGFMVIALFSPLISLVSALSH